MAESDRPTNGSLGYVLHRHKDEANKGHWRAGGLEGDQPSTEDHLVELPVTKAVCRSSMDSVGGSAETGRPVAPRLRPQLWPVRELCGDETNMLTVRAAPRRSPTPIFRPFATLSRGI